MRDNDNFELDFGEKIEDIMSKSKGAENTPQEDDNNAQDVAEQTNDEIQQPEFEDISSSSSKKSKWESIKGWWLQLSKGKKAILISAVAIVLAIGVLMSYVSVRFDYNYDKQFNITVEPKDENIVNVALFGVDCRDENDFTGLTDSIMVLSINKKTDTIKIISVMRDTFVPIIDENKELKKYGKINSAYASGGSDVTKSATIAVNTLNYIYDLDISNYAVINFYGMAEIIDAVGGITATITPDEIAPKGADKPNINGCMQEICREKGLNVNDYYIKSAGEQTLNGVQAVAYARVRHCRSVWGTNNDFGRTDRQRHVMQELFNKAVKMNKSRYIELVDALIPCSKTSLGPTEIVDLAVSVLLQGPGFEQYRLPPEGHITEMLMTSPTGYGSVIYYDIDYAARLMNGIVFEDKTIEQFIEENPIERNDWFKSSQQPVSTPSVAKPIAKPSTDSTSSGSTTHNTSTTTKPQQSVVSNSSQSASSSTQSVVSDESSKEETAEESLTTSGTESKKPTTSIESDTTSSTQSKKPTTSSEIKEPTTSTESSKPTTSSETKEPTTSTGSSKPTTSTQSSKPTTSVESSKPTTSSEIKEPTTSSEIKEPTDVESEVTSSNTESQESSSEENDTIIDTDDEEIIAPPLEDN